MTTHLEFNTECRVRAIGDHEGGSGDEEDDDGFWDDEDLSKDKKGRRRITLRRKTARWTKAQVVLFRATILAIIFMIVEVVGGYISERCELAAKSLPLSLRHP